MFDVREFDPPGVSIRRWLIVAGVSAVVAVAVYALAVLTATGQTLENAALRGADQASDGDQSAADHALGEITVYSLAAAVVVVAVIGLARRRLDLAVAAVGVIVAGQLITQVLKRYLLPRPSLVPVTGDYVENSLPSGHTTIAMTVLFAALIVVPYRWRGVTMFFAMSWAVGIGAYTVTAKWHRVSDTLAADAIALAVACVASWWLARRGAVRHHDGPRRIPRVGFGRTRHPGRRALPGTDRNPDRRAARHAGPGHNDAYVVYLSASTLASFGSIATALVFLATWRRLEIAPPRRLAQPRV